MHWVWVCLTMSSFNMISLQTFINFEMKSKSGCKLLLLGSLLNGWWGAPFSCVGCAYFLCPLQLPMCYIASNAGRTMYIIYIKFAIFKTKSTIFTFQAIFQPCLLHGAAFSKDCYTIETTVNNGGCVSVCTSVCASMCAVAILSQNSICTLISVELMLVFVFVCEFVWIIWPNSQL